MAQEEWHSRFLIRWCHVRMERRAQEPVQRKRAIPQMPEAITQRICDEIVGSIWFDAEVCS
jgi:hypothetical protein